jgi:septum site-determining protein MinD
MGKVILIASGKGGVGKTVFASNAGAKLAQEGYKVVLIDMNMDCATWTSASVLRTRSFMTSRMY